MYYETDQKENEKTGEEEPREKGHIFRGTDFTNKRKVYKGLPQIF